MADFTVRSDHIDVEQIMRQIRARIRDKRGADYTEAEIRELANVKLDKFLDPKAVRSDLLLHYRQQRRPGNEAPMPLYAFDPAIVYTSDRGTPGRILTFIRKLLNPILKLFFNPTPLLHVVHLQTQINERVNKALVTREEFDALNFEMFNNIVVELTRLGIEVRNLRMQVESFGTRLDFDERRARALEGAVQYKPGAPVARPAPPATPIDDAGAAVGAGSAGGDDDEGGDGESGRTRRRRRRRGRRRGQGGDVQGPGGDARPDQQSSPNPQSLAVPRFERTAEQHVSPFQPAPTADASADAATGTETGAGADAAAEWTAEPSAAHEPTIVHEIGEPQARDNAWSQPHEDAAPVEPVEEPSAHAAATPPAEGWAQPEPAALDQPELEPHAPEPEPSAPSSWPSASEPAAEPVAESEPTAAAPPARQFTRVFDEPELPAEPPAAAPGSGETEATEPDGGHDGHAHGTDPHRDDSESSRS